MTRMGMAGFFAAAMVGACNETVTTTSTAGSSNQTITSVPTMMAEATPAMTATSGAAAAATAEATPAAGPTNVLNLNLPKINKSDYFATLHTTKGDITVKFFPEIAPKHVTSFIYLSTIGYYDDAPFHRVCKDFMMQGGDPSGQGSGGPGYTVPREFNARKHVKGVLSAARTPDPDSAGSQFFLMFTAYPSLDNQYSVFGQVIDEDMSVVEDYHKTVAVPQSVPGCRPKSLEKIKNVTVFTKDTK